MYTIKKETHNTETTWTVYFKFEMSEAIVEIYYDKNDINLHLTYKTDGFHWFEFFMSQEPNCKELEFQEYSEHINCRKKVTELFKDNGFIYIPEDKESCFLNGISPYTDDDIKRIADLIDARFANRERFF